MRKTLLYPLVFFLFAASLVFLLLRSSDQVRIEAVRRFNETQRLHARQAAKSIEIFFDNQKRVLELLAANPHVGTLDYEGRASIQNILDLNKDMIQGVTRVGPDGRIAYTYPLSGAAGRDLSGQKHIQAIFASNEPVVSDIINSVQGFRTVVLHVPVISGGRFDGTLGFLLNFEKIAQDYVESIKIAQSGYAFLISASGLVLYYPVPGLTGQSFFDYVKDSPAISDLARRMAAGEEGEATYVFDIGPQKENKILKHAVFMPVRLGDSFWSICVTTPETEALAGVQGFRSTWLLIMGLLVAGGVVATFGFMRTAVTLKEERLRKKAEEALRESERRYRMLVENQTDLVVKVDTQGRFLYVSPSYCRTFGKTEAELLGQAFMPLVHEEDLPGALAALEQLRGPPHTSSHEQRSLTAGGWRWFSWNDAAVLDSNGQVAEIIGVGREISERKEAEQALKRSLAEKTVLLQEIHHRVKNNLQIIVSLLNLQSRNLHDPATVELFARSRNRIHSMSLIHEMLYASSDFSRINLAGYIRAMVERIRSSYRAKSANIELAMDLDPVTLDVNLAIPCGLIINELITNAYKHAFGEDERGAITVALSRADGQVLLSVADTGKGLPGGAVDRSATLGMQLIKALAEQIKAEAVFESQDGTRVTIRFPQTGEREEGREGKGGD